MNGDRDQRNMWLGNLCCVMPIKGIYLLNPQTFQLYLQLQPVCFLFLTLFCLQELVASCSAISKFFTVPVKSVPVCAFTGASQLGNDVQPLKPVPFPCIKVTSSILHHRYPGAVPVKDIYRNIAGMPSRHQSPLLQSHTNTSDPLWPHQKWYRPINLAT